MSDQLTSGGVSLSAEQQFDQVYRAAQPPEVRSLMDMPADSQEAISARVSRGAALAAKGYTIDAPIMIYAWDPYLCMSQRLAAGLTWVPSALQPGLGMPGGYSFPGLNTPGLQPYTSKAPAGAIVVSVNPADYPPFDPPAPVPQISAPVDPVGPQSVGNLYLSTAAGNAYPDGATLSEQRGTFLKHVSVTPFGRMNYWEKIS